MRDVDVVIAGGGIAGLTLALTLHQIGVSCLVLESSTEMKPIGVGINVQPNAVRELYDLGITEAQLDQIGIQAKEWALVGLNGREVYSEPRGLDAGYNWPQYAMHRGAFHMMLYNEVVSRLGQDAVQLGAKVQGFGVDAKGAPYAIAQVNGAEEPIKGKLLIGADGIHSNIRAQMFPDQPPIHWGGAIMWRGTVGAKPLRTKSSFVGLGTHRHRMVIYPISKPDADGLSLVNWIAEVTVDNSLGWQEEGWFREVALRDFEHHFTDFQYDWLNVPEMLAAADGYFENPMIDRDPIPNWISGPIALMGDAAHPMYPTGSNGASQAIIDARVIGAKILEFGVTVEALKAYDNQLCASVSEVVLRNRGNGPFGLLNMLDERCGGHFDNINDVIPEKERREFMSKYKKAAGFERDLLNAAPKTIAI